MISIIKKILPHVICALAIAGCTSSTQFNPLTPVYENIIYNGDLFVNYGDKVPMYWSASDTSLIIKTSYDPGPDSVIGYSTYDNIAIKPGIGQKTGSLSTTAIVPGFQEAFPFTLTVVAFATNDTGSFYVDVYNSANVTRITGPPITGTHWQQYVLTDSNRIADHADSMRVVISAGSTSDTTLNRMIVVNNCFLLWAEPPYPFRY
jgi:hypothetical protein